MSGLQHLSVCLYVGLCKEIGNKEIVCMRRDIDDIFEIIGNERLPYTARRFMKSGSRREGFRMTGSDIDNMIWFNDEKIIYGLSQSEHYHLPCTTLILMECENSPPGFALLKLFIPTNSHITIRRKLRESCARMNDGLYISSTLYREIMCHHIAPNSSIHGPCESGIHLNFEYDFAHCFKCDFWPLSAFPMIQRCQTWPPPLVLYDIVNSGCHLVAKGNPLSQRQDQEWRISFSQAEQKLIYAMNHCQFLVYGLLKLFLKEVINQDVVDKLLCSYFMKTVVFWEIQKNRIRSWSLQYTVVCFWSCFKHIILWVYKGECPNFFIPQNNMFSGKIIGSAQYNLFQQLYGLYEQGYTCLLLCPSVRSHIVQVLYNPTIQVNVNEECFMSVVDFDFQLVNELIHNCLGSEIFTCVKNLRTVEHLITQTPLTRYHIIFIQRCTSTIFQSIAFHLHNSYRDTVSNKLMYILDRISCRMLRFAAKFGFISDMLYVAMYYYRTCRYTQALLVIEITKVKLSQPYIMYSDVVNDEKYTDAVKGLSWPTKIRQAIASEIILVSDICYINELRLEQVMGETNDESALFIPLHITLHMLSVLCYNHVDTMRRQTALDDLSVLVHNDDGVYVPEYFRDISYQILGKCQEICGDRMSAVQSYEQSTRQYPFHKLQRASEIRIRNVLGQIC